ncbi:DUF616 domain-containing protein [Gammaproteobacteria bacterium]|nr:DUF616 domain-containing protein [Gammaproteobacteria bacterium]
MKKIDANDIKNNLDKILPGLCPKTKTDIVVYTAIYGNFDALNEVRNPNPAISYICFTDRDSLVSETWQIIQCKDIDNNPRLLAKIFKVFPNKIFHNAKCSLWVDGNYLVNDNHSLFFNIYKDLKHIKFYKHSLRNCIYDEARIIQKEKPEFDPEIIDQQIKRYKDQKMPAIHGLINGAIILRNHESKLLPKLMDDWWFEIYNYSIRDQLSFNYVNWKNGECAEYFPEEITNFLYFTFKPHLNSSNAGLLLEIKISIKSFIGKVKSYVRNKR